MFINYLFFHWKKQHCESFSCSIMNQSIRIVYFIYLNPKKSWQDIIFGQLYDICKSTILLQDNTPLYLHLVICDEYDIKGNLVSDIYNIFQNDTSGRSPISIDIELQKENLYEYHGIKKMHSLACLFPNDIFLYMHSKGMVFSGGMNGRNPIEVIMTRGLINQWETVIDIFQRFKSVNKIGFFPSNDGFIWFNFFWVRGTYIASCKEPIITEDRYYYESYLGREGTKTHIDCYSLFHNSVGVTFDPYEASSLVFSLPLYDE